MMSFDQDTVKIVGYNFDLSMKQLVLTIFIQEKITTDFVRLWLQFNNSHIQYMEINFTEHNIQKQIMVEVLVETMIDKIVYICSCVIVALYAAASIFAICLKQINYAISLISLPQLAYFLLPFAYQNEPAFFKNWLPLRYSNGYNHVFF